MDVRRLPTSDQRASAGMRKAPAKRLAAFSAAALEKPLRTANTMWPISWAMVKRCRSPQSVLFTTTTGTAPSPLRRTWAVKPSMPFSSVARTLTPRSSNISTKLGTGSMPRPQW